MTIHSTRRNELRSKKHVSFAKYRYTEQNKTFCRKTKIFSLNFGLSGGGFSCVFVHELERNRPNSVIFPRILGHFRLTSCNSVQLRAGFVFKRNRRLTPLGVVLTNLNSPALGGNDHFRLNSGDTNLNFRPTSWAPPKFVSSA